MADKVIRLKDVFQSDSDTHDGRVILKITGTTGKGNVRVELSLDSYDICAITEKLREGVKRHVDKWASTQERIGKNG